MAWKHRVPAFRARLAQLVVRAVAFASEASDVRNEELARLDNTRLQPLSHVIIEHRLSTQDPLAPQGRRMGKKLRRRCFCDDQTVSLGKAAALVV